MKKICLIAIVYFFVVNRVSSQFWQGDTEHFNIINERIQLSAPPEKASSFIALPSETIENASWEFQISMDFNPSSSNYVRVYLVSDRMNLKSALNGYYVEIGGANDQISFSMQKGETQTILISGVEKRVDLQEVNVHLKITRNDSGEWKLFSKLSDENAYILEGSILNYEIVQSKYFGVLCTYTKTRSTKMAMSNLQIAGSAYKDQIKPSLDSLRVTGNNQLKLWFSEEVEFTGENIMSILPYNEVTSINTQSNLVNLTFAQSWMPHTNYTIGLADITDLSGNVMNDTVLNFKKIPFKITKAFVLNENSVFIETNKPIRLLRTENVKFDGKNPEIVNLDKNIAICQFVDLLKNDSSMLLNIRLLDGYFDQQIVDFDTTLIWHKPVSGDLLFTEILADPEPAVYLPKLEYIEVFNTSQYSISLYPLAINVNSKKMPLKAFRQIMPGEFLLISKHDEFNAITEKYKLHHPNFPTLANSGFELWINYKQTIIDYLKYKPEVYSSDAKKEGGWSLERIDLNNYSNINNWAESVNANGGTPAEWNSVNATIDVFATYVEHLGLDDVQNVKIVFSDRLHSSLIGHDNFEVLNNTITNISLIKPEQNTVVITLQDSLSENQKYELNIHNLYDVNTNSINDTTFTLQVSVKPTFGDLVFNELMFEPSENSSEYFELVNTTQNSINLSDLYFAKIKDDGSFGSVTQLSKQPHLVMPSELIVITKSKHKLLEFYSDVNRYLVLECPNLPTLGNESDKLVICNKSLLIIDSVAYHKKWHHPFIKNTKGVALEKKSTTLNSTLSTNWTSASSSSNYSSPTKQNSQEQQPFFSEEVTLSHPTFSPDNDGFEDFTNVQTPSKYVGFSILAKVYSLDGRFVATICNNEIIGNENQFFWDGYNESKVRQPIGVYVIMVEIINPEGKTFVFKLPVSLSSRF